MATIRENIFKVAEAVVRDMGPNGTQGTLGNALQQLSAKAIIGGLGSDDWRKYMSLFADNAEQLERLSTVRDTDESWVKISLAYLVGNGTCGGATTGGLYRFVESGLDTLITSSAPDGNVPKDTELQALISPPEN